MKINYTQCDVCKKEMNTDDEYYTLELQKHSLSDTQPKGADAPRWWNVKTVLKIDLCEECVRKHYESALDAEPEQGE